jgi:calcineurin-like phosphoesterase family protein
VRTYKYQKSLECTVWFTADTHFGHGNIVRFCRRPFADVKEMDAQLIENWNARVRPDDHVFHLGDFCYGCKPNAHMEKLNGVIHLINGSHDKWANNQTSVWFGDFSKKVAIDDNAIVCIDRTQLFLAHHAHRVWPRSHYGTIHLYGHSHGKLPGTASSMDIGVDCNNFMPLNLDEISKKLSEQVNLNAGQ